MVVNSKAQRPFWVIWYKTAAWARLRIWQLKREPFCRFCKRDGKMTEANTVDHIMPHRGDKLLFFDRDNLQSLCKACHSSEKQRIELATIKGCDDKGLVPAWKQNPESTAASGVTVSPIKQKLCNQSLKERPHLLM